MHDGTGDWPHAHMWFHVPSYRTVLDGHVGHTYEPPGAHGLHHVGAEIRAPHALSESPSTSTDDDQRDV